MLEGPLARDESRLAIAAYWLERYCRSTVNGAPDQAALDATLQKIEPLFETKDALAVARNWYEDLPTPGLPNVLSENAEVIRYWALNNAISEAENRPHSTRAK